MKTYFASYIILLSILCSSATAGPIAADIDPTGNAVFYDSSRGSEFPLWQVRCEQPLKSCAAFKENMAFLLYLGGPRLLFTDQEQTRISIAVGRRAQDVPNLARDPLSNYLLEILSKPDARIILEAADGQLLSEIYPTGFVEVLSYLRWIETSETEQITDARQWPQNTAILRSDENEAQIIAHHDDFQRRHEIDMPIHIPFTKPQIEFAIRAQNGVPILQPK